MDKRDLMDKYKKEIETCIKIKREHPEYIIGYGCTLGNSYSKEGIINISDESEDMSYHKNICTINFPNEEIAQEVYKIIMG